MREPSDPEQRGLYGLTGDALVQEAVRIEGANLFLTCFKLFVSVFAGFTALTAFHAVSVGYGSFTPLKLSSSVAGVISLALATYVLHIARSKANLPSFMYFLLYIPLQACVSLCRVAVNLTEGKSIDLFDWIVTPLLIILTLVVWFVTRNLRKTPSI